MLLAAALAATAAELVYVDDSGVMRWHADDHEVALFGANYCLPSASDYRAAGYVGADRKQLVEKDLLHFARMGWDGLRLSFWGDWENADLEGNLIVNDHLDVMDYVIAEAKKRGIYILLSPITTYSAWWPEAKPDDPYSGFSKHYERSKLGTDPAALAAQVNYLRQIMEHVNPYTAIALKDEPQIIFVEMINEPAHHPEDFAGSVNYINALAAAVRSTGCRKLLFHNVSQDMRITSAVKTAQVDGVTFGWYPTGLNLGRMLEGNHLRSVDAFPPMLRPDLHRVPKIVYEFDAPDTNSGYMYPAMARAFRGVGAQFAAMFSYDMLDTAPYNLGWQTHFLNLVYSPRKAVSAVIAAEAMRRLPMYSHYGDYPDNRRFGPIRVSYEEDSSELVAEEAFMHANDTTTTPPDVTALRRIVGAGSSPVVAYEGNGAYFLDKIDDGLWRLEAYPDAVLVQDPFAQQQNYQSVASRLVWRTWPMSMQLPDLGPAFTIMPLNADNTHASTARDGRFALRPGVYLLSREKRVDRARLPERLGRVGLTEFVCPPSPSLPPQVMPVLRAEYPAGKPAAVAVDVIDTVSPRAVTLHLRAEGEEAFRGYPLSREWSYRHTTTLPAADMRPGTLEYYIVVETAGATIRHPAAASATLTARVVRPSEPVVLFDAADDIPKLVYTRIGDAVRRGIFKSMPETDRDPPALRLMFPLSLDRLLEDYTASLSVKDRVRDRAAHVATASALRIQARGTGSEQPFFVTLVEADGTSWSRRLELAAEWRTVDVPLTELALAHGVKLPLGYPERWNYWVSPAKGRGAPGDSPRLAEIERVQISFRPSGATKSGDEDPWADAAAISFLTDAVHTSPP